MPHVVIEIDELDSIAGNDRIVRFCQIVESIAGEMFPNVHITIPNAERDNYGNVVLYVERNLDGGPNV